MYILLHNECFVFQKTTKQCMLLGLEYIFDRRHLKPYHKAYGFYMAISVWTLVLRRIHNSLLSYPTKHWFIQVKGTRAQKKSAKCFLQI